MKTNFGGGKHGDQSSVYLQVLQKLYRMQHLQRKLATSTSNQSVAAQRVAGFRARERARSSRYRSAKCRALADNLDPQEGHSI